MDRKFCLIQAYLVWSYFMCSITIYAKKVLHMPKLRKKTMIDFSRGLPKGYTHNQSHYTLKSRGEISLVEQDTIENVSRVCFKF